MPIQDADRIGIKDFWIEHSYGRIYARIWTPQYDVGSFKSDIPIVLFHDSLGCIDLWRDFPGELSLATGRVVVAYDRLGFGKSDKRSDKLSMNFIAEEAKTHFPVICKQLGIKKFLLFGHSVGGGMAINCAARYPGNCKGLITESAQIFPENRTLEGILAAKEQFKEDRQIEKIRKYHGDKTKWVLDAWTETWLNPAFKSWSLINVLPEVICPVLAIHGMHDEYGSVRHPEMIGELCSGPTQVEIIPDTFHVPHREQAKKILNLVSEFSLRLG